MNDEIEKEKIYVNSLTLDNIWYEYVFINRGKPHCTIWFCNDELDSTIILNIISLYSTWQFSKDGLGSFNKKNKFFI